MLFSYRSLRLLPMSLLLLVWSRPALGLGSLHTPATAEGYTESFPLTDASVRVTVDGRLALTRIVQKFRTTATSTTSGIYQLVLPPDAVLTELGVDVMDGRAAGDAVVQRRALRYPDPRDAAFDTASAGVLRLRIQGGNEHDIRVETEYLQLLTENAGTYVYTLPLTNVAGSLAAGCRLTIDLEVFAPADAEIHLDSTHTRTAVITYPPHRFRFVGAEEGFAEDLRLVIDPPNPPVPSVLSYMPAEGDSLGYYAIWVPRAPGMTPEPLHITVSALRTVDACPDSGRWRSLGGGYFQVGRYRRGGSYTLGAVDARGDSVPAYRAVIALACAGDSADSSYGPVDRRLPALWGHFRSQMLQERFSTSTPALLDTLSALGMTCHVVNWMTTLASPRQGSFTLLADTRRGRRPSFTRAAPPEEAEALYDRFAEALGREGVRVGKGVFGGKMAVSLLNWGPVTLLLSSGGTET